MKIFEVNGSEVIKIEKAFGFGFGIIFLGLVFYVAARDIPITDPGQFFLLRLIASISASGVAAVIPGFITVSMNMSTSLIIRAGGGARSICDCISGKSSVADKAVGNSRNDAIHDSKLFYGKIL